MELALGLLAAASAFLAIWAATARNNERERALRLMDELESVRRPAQMLEPVRETEVPMRSSEETALPDSSSNRLADDRLEQALDALKKALLSLEGGRNPPDEEDSDTTVAALDATEVARQEARKFLLALDRSASTLAALAQRAASFRSKPIDAENPPAAEPGVEVSESHLIAAAAATADEMSDPTSRLLDDVGSILRNAERIRNATLNADVTLAVVLRSMESLTPLAPALSSLSNRINLLALNLAVLLKPASREPGDFDNAGEELRGLFEETRRLSREVGSLSQRASGAARTARESTELLADAALDGQARAEKGLESVQLQQELSRRLRHDLEELHRASHQGDETRLRLERQIREAIARRSALAMDALEFRRDVGLWLSELKEIATSFQELRRDGDSSVRGLLSALDAEGNAMKASLRSEARSVELVREAAAHLSTSSTSAS